MKKGRGNKPGRCGRCPHVGPIAGRGLCGTCYWRGRQDGDLPEPVLNRTPYEVLVERYVELASEGLSVAKAAEELQVASKTLYRALRARGVDPVVSRVPHDVLREEHEHLSSMGFSDELIASRLGVSIYTLHHVTNQRSAA